MKINQHIRTTWTENKKVGENYVFMTALQLINMCFYLLVYPLLIRRMGADSYGLYAFAWSVVTIAAAIVGFGFDLIGTKQVSTAVATTSGEEQQQKLSEVLSSITWIKTGLLIAMGVIYGALLYTIPWMDGKRLIFGIAFMQTGVNIVFPQWYFQGVQRMRIVTYIQLIVKVASLPLIFIFIQTPDDTWILMLITVLSGWAGGCIAAGVIRWKDGIRLVRIRVTKLKQQMKEAFPLFLTNMMSILKEQGVVMLAGSCLGMREVAIYDLANKIVTVPRIMMLQINNALFPKMVMERQADTIRKIMRWETVLSLSVVVLTAAVGKWCVLVLGGADMLAAWPVSILLSSTILCWMIGTAYIDFVFIPTGNNKLVAWNQLVALLSFAIVAGTGVMFWASVYVIVGALVVSGICEILFCTGISHRKQLMQQV